MPIYNGDLVEWRQISSILRQSPIDCSLCGDFHNNTYIQHPITGYAISICYNCLEELPSLFPNHIKSDTDLKPFISEVKCHICSRYIPLSNLFVINDNTTFLCANCYDNNTWGCQICHRIYSNDMETGDFIDGDTSLRVCFNCCERDGHLIKPYDYNPEFKFYKTTNDKKTLLYFGIELEVESSGNNKRSIIKSFPKFVYVKADSSISDGFEIVSHPMTYRWLKDNANKWNKILIRLCKKGYHSFNTQTCGMHIHLSKAAFGNFHLYKFMKMFYDNNDFIRYISQRNRIKLADWASVTDSEENIIYKAKYKTRGHENRHTAINLSRDNSVEIRIFRGTLCLPSFWKNIEFAKALYDFSHDFPPDYMNEIKFRSFIKSKYKEFPNLCNFLWSINKNEYEKE